MKPPSAVTVREVAAKTPVHRDRYVDFLRVFSLAVVVLGHWLMAVITWRNGKLASDNVLEVAPWAQWLTWLFQIMPVFFFVGGFANSASWAASVRHGSGYGTWLGSRLQRLVRPVLAFALVWSAAVAVLRLAGVNPAAFRAGSIAQPLWFLAVYVAVLALAPALIAAQRRWGWRVAVALAAGVALVDLARWPAGVPLVGWLNLALVWIFAFQLGVAWRAGAVTGWSRGRLLGLAGVGLGVLLVLTGPGGYPHSMVGGLGDGRSNTFPPSLALVALATWQFGLAIALRPLADRWLARAGNWGAVVVANTMAMTVFLWHLTAMVLVAAVTVPTGLMPEAAAGSAAWWAWRPLWLALLAVALVPLTLLFAPVERRSTRPSPRPRTPVAPAVAALLMTVGMGMLARRGFVAPGLPFELPLVGLGLVAGGWVLLRDRAAEVARVG